MCDLISRRSFSPPTLKCTTSIPLITVTFFVGTFLRHNCETVIDLAQIVDNEELTDKMKEVLHIKRFVY